MNRIEDLRVVFNFTWRPPNRVNMVVVSPLLSVSSDFVRQQVVVTLEVHDGSPIQNLEKISS